jgi:hypothetical protein
MLWRPWFLIIFFWVAACHSPVTEPVKIIPSNRLSQDDPFNRQDPLIFTKHARCRMDCRHITPGEIHEILDRGMINYAKSDPASRPDPKYAVEGYTDEKQHLRIIIAPESDKLIVITCIELGVEWSCDCN